MKRLAAALALILAAATARADGAFPDELQILFPADGSHRVLSTNFGLVLDGPDGGDWRMICEALISTSQLVSQYQLGPDGSVFASHGGTISRSVDGCRWTASSGLEPQVVRDFWVDPTDANRVYALASGTAPNAPTSLYASTDGAATFGAPLFTQDGGGLTGIESARTDAGVVYLAGYEALNDGGALPFVMQSGDRGATWTTHGHPELAGSLLGIAQVDATDAQTVYLRAGYRSAGEALAISHDGAQTLALAVNVQQPLAGFARTDDGTLFVGDRFRELWVAEPDSGFVERAGPQLRCLGARGNALYACGDNFGDGFALGRSDDRGQTFQPVLRFEQVQGLVECPEVKAACGAAWDQFAAAFKITTTEPDAGPPAPAPPKKSGCASGSGSAPLALLGLALLSLPRRARTRRSRAQSRHPRRTP